ncbi:hypothetical protein [Novosphingobium resinovorum]|uniref:hypothetical protein n=1 Tax=Novosphingobium resinovorum TaxID=158500 RepID=UPI003D268826
MPTVVDARRVAPRASTPVLRQGRRGGTSLLPYLEGKSDVLANGFDGMGFELFGNEAFISGDWKILKLRAPEGDDTWKLFNIAWDPGESRDLSQAYPVRFAALKEAYAAYAAQNGVISPPSGFKIVPTGWQAA